MEQEIKVGILYSVFRFILLSVFANAKVVRQTNGAYTQIQARTPCVCICAASSTSQAGMLRRSHWFYGLQFARKSSLPYHHFARTCTIFDGHQRFLARCLPASRGQEKESKEQEPTLLCRLHCPSYPSTGRDSVKRLIIVLSGFLHFGFLEKEIYVHLSSRPPRQKINTESFSNEWPRVLQRMEIISSSL